MILRERERERISKYSDFKEKSCSRGEGKEEGNQKKLWIINQGLRTAPKYF